MKKELLSSLLIGAFVFGLGAADIQPVSAASSDKQVYDGYGMTHRVPPDRNNGDNSNRPEPPKDKDGNPLPPPDRNNGDSSNRPEPPKDKDGNPLPPPDRNNGDSSNRPTPRSK